MNRTKGPGRRGRGWSSGGRGGSKVEVEELRRREVFHESDRAQIAVICRHKLHDRIIAPRAETKAVAGASESPRIGRNSVVPERASPFERCELLLSPLVVTRTSTFRYGGSACTILQRRSRSLARVPIDARWLSETAVCSNEWSTSDECSTAVTTLFLYAVDRLPTTCNILFKQRAYV